MAAPMIKLNNGLAMPQLGLGASQGTYEAIRAAISCGYRLFDTAEAYKNEEAVGRAVNDAIKAGDVKRENLFITTKIWTGHFARDQVVPTLRESLKRLSLDYVDLYLVHFPCATKGTLMDFITPIEFDNNLDINAETWPGMEECVQLGLAKSIGVSNYNSQQIDALMKVAKIKPVTNQVESHPFLSQRKLIDHCAKHGIIITSYSPMGGTPVDGEMAKALSPLADFEVRKILFDNELVKKLAHKYGKSSGQILIRFHIDRGCVVIPKSVNKSRIEENIDVFDFALTKEEVTELEALNQNVRYIHNSRFRGHKNYPFDIEY